MVKAISFKSTNYLFFLLYLFLNVDPAIKLAIKRSVMYNRIK